MRRLQHVVQIQFCKVTLCKQIIFHNKTDDIGWIHKETESFSSTVLFWVNVHWTDCVWLLWHKLSAFIISIGIFYSYACWIESQLLFGSIFQITHYSSLLLKCWVILDRRFFWIVVSAEKSMSICQENIFRKIQNFHGYFDTLE